MLLLLYPDASIATKIVEDPQTAPIPDLHKAMYAWVKKFVRSSWDMTANEVQPVLRALRNAGIHVVALHNHMIGGDPMFYFTHYWGTGPAAELAQAIRSVLDAQEDAARRE